MVDINLPVPVVAIVTKAISLARRKNSLVWVRDPTDTNSANTIMTTLTLVNQSDEYESNLEIKIEATVGKESHVRFKYVQVESLDDLNELEINYVFPSEEQGGLSTYGLNVTLDGLSKKEALLVVILSDEYIGTLKASARSGTNRAVYNSIID